MDPNQQQSPQQIPDTVAPTLPQQSIDFIQEPIQLSQPPSRSVMNQPSADNSGMVNAPAESSPSMQPAGGSSVKESDSLCDIEQFPSRIEELRQMLLDKDRDVVKQSARIIHSAAAKQPENARLIIRNYGLRDAVVAALVAGRKARDFDLIKSTVCTLYWISETGEDGCNAIIHGHIDTISHLVAFLSSDFEQSSKYALAVLHNLLRHDRLLVPFMIRRSADAIQSYVRLLERDNPRYLLPLTIGSLRILTKTDTETQRLILEHNAHIRLIRILNSGSKYNEKVLWMTSQLILTLCNRQHTKRLIVKAGGISALTKHVPALGSSSNRLVLTCLNALRNLSDEALFAKDVDGLLDTLILCLDKSADRKVIDYSLATLYNLTCKNSRNKQHVCEGNGVETVMRVLIAHWSDPEIAENALGALRHLIWRTIFDDQTRRRRLEIRMSRDKLLQLGCLPLICRYMEPPHQFLHHPTLMIEALSLLRNLAMGGGASWQEFRQCGIVEALANMVRHICSSNGLFNEYPSLFGYRRRVLDRAFMALSVLCQCEENRRILLDDAHIMDIANQVIIHAEPTYLKKSASEFVEALRAPFHVDVAQLLEV